MRGEGLEGIRKLEGSRSVDEMKGRSKKRQSQGTHDSGDWDPGSFLNMGWSLQVCVCGSHWL